MEVTCTVISNPVPPDVSQFLINRGWTSANNGFFLAPPPYALYSSEGYLWTEALSYEQFRWWNKLDPENRDG